MPQKNKKQKRTRKGRKRRMEENGGRKEEEKGKKEMGGEPGTGTKTEYVKGVLPRMVAVPIMAFRLNDSGNKLSPGIQGKQILQTHIRYVFKNLKLLHKL